MRGLYNLALLGGLSSTVYSASFAPATGPYQIGITYHVWTHSDVNDTIAPANASDKLAATIYYPTFSIPNNTRNYLDPKTGEVYESFFGFEGGSLTSLQTPFQLDAPPLNASTYSASNPQPPTIIISPPSNINAAMDAALVTYLVSYGYNVVALDHPGEPPTLHLPTGDVPGIPLGGNSPMDLIMKLWDLRIQDTLAVMGELWAPFVESFGAPLNTTHFFILGHSLGGQAAATIAQKAPEKVVAGVNLDGSFFAETQDVKKPFLVMTSDGHRNAPDQINWAGNQTGWWLQLEVAGARHHNFYDRGDWFDILGQRDLPSHSTLGTIWSPRMDFIVGNYVLAFLEKVLGKEQFLLQGPTVRFPEVRFVNGSQDALPQ